MVLSKKNYKDKGVKFPRFKTRKHRAAYNIELMIITATNQQI